MYNTHIIVKDKKGEYLAIRKDAKVHSQGRITGRLVNIDYEADKRSGYRERQNSSIEKVEAYQYKDGSIWIMEKTDKQLICHKANCETRKKYSRSEYKTLPKEMWKKFK